MRITCGRCHSVFASGRDFRKHKCAETKRWSSSKPKPEPPPQRRAAA